MVSLKLIFHRHYHRVGEMLSCLAAATEADTWSRIAVESWHDDECPVDA